MRFNESVSGRVSAGTEGKGGPGSDRDAAGGPGSDSEASELKMRTPKLAVTNLTKFKFLFLGNGVYKESSQ